ncbi:MAG TPA: siderophore-interacting protein [Pseudonocardiaceae bacterium]|jgi:NADPH-dependent ferric siderophore reductase|nr:siderophore-interacting protein [Pseudonocardiaceae bacterium]
MKNFAVYLHGQVELNEPYTGRIRRITITGPALLGLDWRPGQHVRVHVGDVGPRSRPGPLRTYSIWDYRTDTIDLCVLDHGDDTPGVRWARTVRPGQDVVFTRPAGKLVPRKGEYHVFVGEETASVAFGPMARALPAGAPVFGVIEVDSPKDRLRLPDTVLWRYRDGASAVASDRLVAEVRKLELPDEPGIAYVAGELRTLQAVRRHFVRERGWPRKCVVIKPFWTPGRSGMD